MVKQIKTTRPGRAAASAVKYTLLIFWALVQVFPLYWLFTFSLKNNTEIFGLNPIGLPREWQWSNYQTVFDGTRILRYILNSTVVTAVTIVLVSILALMATYALSRMVWRGRGAVRSLYMLGLAIPMHAALLPVYLMLRDLSIHDSYWALIIPYTAFTLSMAILIFSGFMVGIPRELEESACLDGCNIYGIFFRIITPLMVPAISVVAIFTFLQCWNELLFASVYISSSDYTTLTVGVMQMSGQFRTSWGPIGAGLVVATLPTLVMYIILSEKVQKSLIMGALKG